MKTLITDNQSLVSAKSRFGHEIPVYDDGFGPLFIHRDSMGISGIVRAQTWEDAYSICEDEFFPAADDEAAEAITKIEAMPEGEERDHEQACFDEAYGYRGNSLAMPDGSTSSIYAKDLNGDSLDKLTPELLEELEITLTITSPEKEEITRHAARALFASAWADYQEQSPDGENLSGCDILDVMPQEIPAEAMEAAQALVAGVERLNGESIDSILERAAGLPDDHADRECDAEYFGHYLAMEAMGTGVGLERVCDRDALGLKLPHVEFSYLNLNPADYPDFAEVDA